MKLISRNVMITGTLLIWAIKFIIRPYVHIPQAYKLLAGIAPNLLGAFLLPFGACWFFERFFRLRTQRHLTFTCSFGLLLVIVNEYLQRIPFFGRTFDYMDIVFSVVGVFLGHLVFGWLMATRPQTEERALEG